MFLLKMTSMPQCSVHRNYAQLNDCIEKLREPVFAHEQISLPAYLALLHSLGEKAQFRGQTVFYPAGGCDAWTVFALNPECRDVVKVSLERYGAWTDVLGGVKQIAALPQKDKRLFIELARSYKFDAIKSFAEWGINCGSYELFKLGVYGAHRITSIGSFDIDEAGTLHFGEGLHNCVQLEDTAGTMRTVWHLYGDLDQPGPEIKAFLQKMQPDAALLKAALNVFDPVYGGGFYKYFSELARQTNVRILCDKPLSYTQYPIWKSSGAPDKIFLRDDEAFGYCKGARGNYVLAGDGKNVLSYSELIKSDYAKYYEVVR